MRVRVEATAMLHFGGELIGSSFLREKHLDQLVAVSAEHGDMLLTRSASLFEVVFIWLHKHGKFRRLSGEAAS